MWDPHRAQMRLYGASRLKLSLQAAQLSFPGTVPQVPARLKTVSLAGLVQS